MSTAKGTFDIAVTPRAAEIEGAVGRLDFTKTLYGGLDAIGRGLMLSCGDPRAGEAGYVAIETVEGRIGEREGSFALQQFGTMHGGSQGFTTRWHPDLAAERSKALLARSTSRSRATGRTGTSWSTRSEPGAHCRDVRGSTDGRRLAEWLSLLRSADSNSERTQLPPRSI